MRRRWNKIMALLLASAVLTANVGVVSTFAAGDEKTQQAAQNDESKEETDSEDKKQDDEKTTQTAAPTATVKEGTYSETQKITLKSSAKDAVIYYTTDGKEPTEKSTRFDAKKPIEVKKTTTIKAIAVSKETGKSKIATFTYKIGESDKKEESKETPAAEQTPSATPTTAPTEIPKQAQTSSEQGEAQLMPTSAQEEKVGEAAIDSATLVQEVEAQEGMELTEFDKKDAVQITGEATVEDIKWENAEDASETKFKAGKTYKVTVALSANEGYQFEDTTTVTFNDVEGTRDTTVTDQVVYTFEVAAPSAPEMNSSLTESDKFIDGVDGVELKYEGTDDATTEFSLDEGSNWDKYSSGKKVTLTADDDGNCTVMARAVKNKIAVIVSETYKVQVTKPEADIEPGTYTERKEVALSATPKNAKIYYTLDGSEPDDKDILYNDPIEVQETTTIKAIAYDADGNASEVAVFEYVINIETPTPTPTVKKITSIDVLELNKPSRGAKPDRKAKASSDSHATVESVEWLKDNTGDDIEGVFKAGTAYYAYVHLKAKDGYEFDTSAFKQGSTTENAKVSNYSSNPGVKSVSKSDLVVYVAWKTQAAVTASTTQNTITGLNASYNKGATVTFTMNGAGADNPSEEGNERYVPVKYKIGNSEFKFEDNQNPKLAKSFTISTAGTYTLTVTFQKQVYDAESGKWKNVDGVTDTKTATVKINATTTSTGTLSKTGTASKTTTTTTSTTSKAKNAKTGDETPVGAVVTVFVLAGASVVVLIARKRKSQK